MSDEVWAKSLPPSCPRCNVPFPRLLRIKISSEGNFNLYMECHNCLYEMEWRFGVDDVSDQWVDALMDRQQEIYGDDVGDFAAWEESFSVESDPEAGIQLELPDMDWWYL